MTQKQKTRKNNIGIRQRIYCFLDHLSDPKFSLNKKYANSTDKIKYAYLK